MKIAIAGAFGHLGYDILKQAIAKNYEVIALDLKEKDNPYKGKYLFHPIDVIYPIDIFHLLHHRITSAFRSSAFPSCTA